MKEIYLLIFCLFSILAVAQENYKLAKTIDSLYEQDQSVQLKLKAMYDRMRLRIA